VNDISGNSVSTAGDVNGDGLNDLIVGARGKLKAGKFYVIFGKKDNTTIELSAIETELPLISSTFSPLITNPPVPLAIADRLIAVLSVLPKTT
jgi:hypothetical protein